MDETKENRITKVGIGFATGRKSFQKVLKTYAYNFRESGLTADNNVKLNLLVAYDLKYKNTQINDYTGIHPEVRCLIDRAYFIDGNSIQREADELVERKILTKKEALLFFGHSGYAAKRNAVLYTAIKNKLDYLLFLDDDEYPMAVTKTRTTAVWGGQQVLSTHLKHIEHADITNGHHCGYISPIPYIEFDDSLTEADFRLFIDAISNDIINWKTIRSVMNNGGVTYANTAVLINDSAEEVSEINSSKFISGSNLCINLTRPDRVRPFYNPPRARGEDSFLATCLSDRKILRVPCYTFHDGFSTYQHIMDGVLPINLKYMRDDNEQVISRFYRACIGWIRYKPLLLYITQRDSYTDRIDIIREQLRTTLPKICAHFGKNDFMNIAKELELYNRNVEEHYRQFADIKRIWDNISKSVFQRTEMAAPNK